MNSHSLRPASCLGFLLMVMTVAGPAKAQSTSSGQPGSPEYYNPNLGADIERAQAQEIRGKMEYQGALDEQQRQNDELRRMGLMQGARQNDPDIVILPPLPPVLFGSSAVLSNLSYPEVLAPCAGESFFMAYAGLLTNGTLRPPDERRIARYIKSRDRLAAAVRQKLAESENLAPELRRERLREFASAQASDLRALEIETEAIRRELADLNAGTALLHRREAVKSGESAAFVEYCSALLAAEFHAGLSLDQRELLHAIALEALVGNSPESAGGAPEVFYFLPAPARIPRPTADQSLDEKLRQFEVLRESLESELRQALRDDPKQPEARRTKQYAALAQAQAAGFAELHRRAEELRPQLAGLSYPSAPPPPGDAPPALLLQVQRTFVRKAALQHRVSAELQELRRLLPNDKVALVQNGQLPNIGIAPRAPGDKSPNLSTAENDALRDRLKKINGQLEQRTITLTKEIQLMQQALREYRDKNLQTPDLNLNQLAASLAESASGQEHGRLYRDYQAAVLQPGLSPEQRRLLLHGALAGIEQARLRDPWAD